uniref:Putative secreted protein n=1 Tax=Ixodes ricinus TaxID=34613 RepID=A0A6B0U6P9_IXORI
MVFCSAVGGILAGPLLHRASAHVETLSMMYNSGAIKRGLLSILKMVSLDAAMNASDANTPIASCARNSSMMSSNIPRSPSFIT